MILCAAVMKKLFGLLVKSYVFFNQTKIQPISAGGQLILLFIFSLGKSHKVQNVFHAPTLLFHEDT